MKGPAAGRASRRSSSRRSSGSRGTTSTACSNRSGTFPRPSSRRPINIVRRLRPRWRFSRNELSGEPGAVHIAALDVTTGLPAEWRADADGDVSSLAVSGSTLLAGGGFYGVGGVPARGVAIIYDPSMVGVPMEEGRGRRFVIEPSLPNPIRDRAVLRFVLPERGRVCLDVLDLAGRRVRTVLDEVLLESGPHSMQFECGKLVAGIYFLRLRVQDGATSRKLIIIR